MSRKTAWEFESLAAALETTTCKREELPLLLMLLSMGAGDIII